MLKNLKMENEKAKVERRNGRMLLSWLPDYVFPAVH